MLQYLMILLLYLISAAFCLTSQHVLAQETSAAPLEVLQVEKPLRSSYEGAVCTQVLVQHSFAASYGNPFVGTYVPPADCIFTTTIFNLTITSNGTNYDRLALLFLSDTEVWRFSTAMPTRAGIYSNFQKDMTIYSSLLSEPQKIILVLDNIFDSIFTGAFNVTITSLHYLDSFSIPLTPASQILPITTSSSSQNSSSAFSLPDDDARVPLILPRNTKNAVVSILASGNGNEEFWYRKGVPKPYINTFNNSQLHGFSPFREIQLSIDDQLAGVSWPFPIVFTGGINPGLWRPVVGIDVYDIPSFEIDISPWLGILCDGKEHIFGLKAVGYDTGAEDGLGAVGDNWVVTGSIFLWLDKEGSQTVGTAPEILTPNPTFTLQRRLRTTDNTNTTLWINLLAQRTLSIISNITSSSGTIIKTWSQELSYRNTQNLTAAGYNNAVSQLTTGISTFSSGSNTFNYPLEAYTIYKLPNSTSTNLSYLLGSIDHSLLTHGTAILPFLTGSIKGNETLSTRQNGTCIYYWDNVYYEGAGAIDPQAGSIGATDQWYSYSGKFGEYGRIIKAKDGLDDYQGTISDEVFGHAVPVPETGKVIGEDL